MIDFAVRIAKNPAMNARVVTLALSLAGVSAAPAAAIFIQPTNATLLSPAGFNGGSAAALIQSTSLTYTEEHQTGPGVTNNQAWVNGNNATMLIRFFLGDAMSLDSFYLWNDSQTDWAADAFTITFRDGSQAQIGATFNSAAALGVNPSTPETFSVGRYDGVVMADISFSGRSSGVEITDVAFGLIPEPSSVMLLAMAWAGSCRRRR